MRGDDVKGRLAAAGPKSRTPLAEGLREVRVRALDSYRILPGKCEVLPHMGCLANGCRRIEGCIWHSPTTFTAPVPDQRTPAAHILCRLTALSAALVVPLRSFVRCDIALLLPALALTLQPQL